VKIKGQVSYGAAAGSLSATALVPLDASHVPYVTQDMKFDDEFILTLPSDKPAPNRKFEITLANGKKIKGTSDAQGRTGVHKGVNHEFLNVKLLPKNA
jgi:type VI secretion system secreted protein VgrG